MQASCRKGLVRAAFLPLFKAAGGVWAASGQSPNTPRLSATLTVPVQYLSQETRSELAPQTKRGVTFGRKQSYIWLRCASWDFILHSLLKVNNLESLKDKSVGSYQVKLEDSPHRLLGFFHNTQIRSATTLPHFELLSFFISSALKVVTLELLTSAM